MYWKFGVQGIGTSFRIVGLIKADNKVTAILKMNEWTKEQSDETLNSYLLYQERQFIDGKPIRPEVVLDWEINNDIQIVIE